MNDGLTITIGQSDIMVLALLALLLITWCIMGLRGLAWRHRFNALAGLSDLPPPVPPALPSVPAARVAISDDYPPAVKRLRDVPSVGKLFVDFLRDNEMCGEILHRDLYEYYEAEFVPVHPDLRVIPYNQMTMQLEAVGCQRGTHRHPGRNSLVTIIIPESGVIGDQVARASVPMPAARITKLGDHNTGRGANGQSRSACEAARDDDVAKRGARVVQRQAVAA